jgi:hypothetical protein
LASVGQWWQVCKTRRQNTHIRSRCNPPKKGRDSSHQAAVPCDNCGKRHLASRALLVPALRHSGDLETVRFSADGGPGRG